MKKPKSIGGKCCWLNRLGSVCVFFFAWLLGEIQSHNSLTKENEKFSKSNYITWKKNLGFNQYAVNCPNDKKSCL